MDPDLDESGINELFIKSAKEAILFTDRSKFGKEALHNFTNFSDINVLITDAGVDDELLNSFQERSVQVVKTVLQLINNQFPFVHLLTHYFR